MQVLREKIERYLDIASKRYPTHKLTLQGDGRGLTNKQLDEQKDGHYDLDCGIILGCLDTPKQMKSEWPPLEVERLLEISHEEHVAMDFGFYGWPVFYGWSQPELVPFWEMGRSFRPVQA